MRLPPEENFTRTTPSASQNLSAGSEIEAQAELFGSRLIIWEPKIGLHVYRNGFFGKPVGIPKPKPEQDFEAPLLLDLMEGLYLSEHHRLKVVEAKSKRSISRSVLVRTAKQTYRGFGPAYLVYKDLRNKGYVVTPGIKFGADFAVYEHGPGIDHAPFIISVESPKEVMGPFEVVRAGRLATTVRKQFIIAIPDVKANKVRYLVFQWFKA